MTLNDKMLRTLSLYSYDFTLLLLFTYCVALIIDNILIAGRLKKNNRIEFKILWGNAIHIYVYL